MKKGDHKLPYSERFLHKRPGIENENVGKNFPKIVFLRYPCIPTEHFRLFSFSSRFCQCPVSVNVIFILFLSDQDYPAMLFPTRYELKTHNAAEKNKEHLHLIGLITRQGGVGKV